MISFFLGGAVETIFETSSHTQLGEVMSGLRKFKALLEGIFSPHYIPEVEWRYEL